MIALKISKQQRSLLICRIAYFFVFQLRLYKLQDGGDISAIAVHLRVPPGSTGTDALWTVAD
jgi:hypothetical protein